MSFVSDAGSTRSSALPEARTWFAVASTSTHERAFTPGGGTCAKAVALARSVAGSSAASVTLRTMEGETKEDGWPEERKRIGSGRAELGRDERSAPCGARSVKAGMLVPRCAPVAPQQAQKRRSLYASRRGEFWRCHTFAHTCRAFFTHFPGHAADDEPLAS